MHDNDIISKIEYLLVKYNASYKVCSNVHDLADRTCWPFRNSKDYRYIAIAMMADMFRSGIIDPVQMDVELATYSMHQEYVRQAYGVSMLFDYLFTAEDKIDIVIRGFKGRTKYMDAVFTAFTEREVERLCREHSLRKASRVLHNYNYIMKVTTHTEDPSDDDLQ